MEIGVWKKVFGYLTPGGDPVWACPKCGKSEHVYGVENPNRKDYCDNCGQRNIYPWEKSNVKYV